MKKCFKGFVQLAVALTFISSAYADKAAVTKAMAKSMPSMKENNRDVPRLERVGKQWGPIKLI